MASDAVLELRAITKRFGPADVLKDVSLSLPAGQVTALIGENGAGKSTLMRIVAGILRPDAGSVFMGGTELRLSGPHDARRAGIALSHQELSVIGSMTVAENLSLVLEQAGERRPTRERLTSILGLWAPGISATALVESLSLADQYRVEIAGAMAMAPRIAMFDEPTSALSEQEANAFLTSLRHLSDSGTAVVFTSHRIDEVYTVADRIAVLKDGVLVCVEKTAALSRDDAVRRMVGRPLLQMFPPRPEARPGASPPALSVEGLATASLHDIHLRVGGGEIVGLGGLDGQGQRDVLRALFGLVPTAAGTVRVEGKTVRLNSPGAAVRAGIGFVPVSRREEGLALGLSILRNVEGPMVQAGRSIISRSQTAHTVTDALARLRVHYQDLNEPAGQLSGGNQQKLVLAKWLTMRRRVLLLDEPTRGIDVGAKLEIYQSLRHLTEENIGVLMVSSDLLELIGLSDRILVMFEGRIVGELEGRTATEESVTALAVGTGGVSA